MSKPGHDRLVSHVTGTNEKQDSFVSEHVEDVPLAQAD